jgi:hypothetical protein
MMIIDEKEIGGGLESDAMSGSRRGSNIYRFIAVHAEQRIG